jgi:serine-type D-Ala-D-Ala carboxypeptidase
MLVEDGLLGLNRPVQEYVPEFVGEGKEAVMVHHLLTHTCGWDDARVEEYAEERKGKVKIPPCPETVHPVIHEDLWLRLDAPLARPPGQEMSYCSAGFNLLGEIVRRVSGESLNSFAHEHIFEPLGMKDTAYAISDEKHHRVVRRRPLDPPPFGLDDPEYHKQPWPEAGVLSTAMDMAIFGQMFLERGSYDGRGILSLATVAEMTRNQIPGISAQFFDEFIPEAGWGYGWDITGNKKARDYPSLDSSLAFGHAGSGGVFLAVDPTLDTVCVYFSVAKIRSAEVPMPVGCFDLFANVVAASVL